MINRLENDTSIIYVLDDGKLHRPNGPARIWKSVHEGECSEFWWLYGVTHRYYGKQLRQWWIHGVQIDC